MFRTKKDVERHVLDVLSKIDNENEKNLRGYTFARLFFQVKDYEAARKYLSGFLSVRDHHAPAHKLMAQIYESTNSPENALQSYKRSLEIDSHQSDIVLKICELYCLLTVDHETARYWADRAEQIYPHNEIVFKLREYLVTAEGDTNHQELENLIATELQAQPKNIDLRIKLLRLYLDTERVKDAYEHATLIESKKLFPSSHDWYYTLADIFEAYQEEFKEELDSQFFINYLTTLDHLIFLNLAEPHSQENRKKPSSLSDAADVLYLFDKYLKEALEKDIKDGPWVYFMHHMKGQLFFYMASILIKKAKLDQGNRKEALRFSAGLILVCYAIKPSNLLQEIWFSQMNENQKLFTHFFQQGSIRTCFIGHVIKNICKEDKCKWLQKMKSDVCISQVKDRIFNRIFSSVANKKNLPSSYFLDTSTFENSTLEFPNDTSLKEYDKVSYKLCSSSLHHLVWLEFHRRSSHFQTCYLTTEIFKGLQYSNKNLSKGSCESLCILDLEAYLHAAVYHAESEIEKKKALFNNWNQDVFLSCPPDFVDAMCPKQQAEWWKTAHNLHSCAIKEKLGEARRILQHGLEVIRGIGNHGMEVQLVIYLARFFADRAEYFLKDMKNSNEGKKNLIPENITSLQQRATHYWNIALGMLEKLLTGGIIKPPKEKMFAGFDKILSKNEIRTLQEDGKLYIAVQLMESEKLNEAAEILSKLSSPYGSFYLALTLKKFATQEEKFSNTRAMFLTKAESAIHDTMDRIRDDNAHPLNKDIHIILGDIENELTAYRSISNGNNEDIDEVDSYDTSQSSVYTTPNSFNANLCSTPKPSSKFMSTSSALQKSNKEYSKHFEPSPERLDAQIRALALNQDTVLKTVMEQNKSLLETNKSVVETNKSIVETNKSTVETLHRNCEILSELKKLLEELKISGTKSQSKTTMKKSSFSKGQGEEEYESFDPNSLLDFYEENNEDYRTQGYNYNPSSRLVQEAAASLNYVVPSTLPPGPPPPLAHYNYQYPPHAMLPAAPVPERPQFYPPPGQSLPFSEGQQLPQFHFHVASPVVKPPAPLLSSVSSIPHAVPMAPPLNLQQPPASIQTSNSTLPMTNPWTKPVGVPHAFQIPLPPSSSFISATTLIPHSLAPNTTSSVVTTQSTLKNLLMATTSGNTSFSHTVQPTSPVSTKTQSSLSIFSGVIKSPEHLKLERSRCDSDNIGSPEIDAHDIEREVMGDFKPLIPLPDEIVVETGEEDEIALFEDRAKLYRFVDQEWKERGLGTVKILYHEESKRVRLLMRRDQVLKVCANHYITSNMEIKPMQRSDRAWTWVAQDFADEELKPEQFCIRFKTPELALSFKKAFEKAIRIVKNNETKIALSPNKHVTVTSPNSQKPFGSKFLPKSGSWTCPTCYISNSSERLLCEACDTKKPGSITAVTSSDINTPNFSGPVNTSSSVSSTSPFSFKMPSYTNQFTFGANISSNKTSSDISSKPGATPKNEFGGFTFSTSPTIHEIEDPDAKEREILVVSTKSKNGPQITKVTATKNSPFSGFSFTSPPPTTNKPSLFQSSDLKNLTLNENKVTTEASSTKGFSFNNPPVTIATTQSSKITESLSKEIEPSKPSHISNFSLKPTMFSGNNTTLTKTVASESTPVANLSKIQSLVQNVSPAFVFNSKETATNLATVNHSEKPSDICGPVSFSPITTDAKLTKTNTEGAPEDFVPTAEFKPVVPLPALIELKTGEEDEEQKFCERAKLFRYDSDSKEWKERGTGELKILYLKDSQKYRILMRRDQVLKICANHYILPEMKLTLLPSNDRARVWCAQDFADGNWTQEKFVVRFKTVDIAKKFSEVFEKCQIELRHIEKKTSELNPCKGNEEAFDKLMKPALDSWQCSNCQQYNSNQSTCSFCKTVSNADVSKTASKEVTNQKPLSELFKPAADSWECPECLVRNNSINLKCASCESTKPGLANTQSSVSVSNNQSLSNLFKSVPGSWICESCMLRNSPVDIKCPSCEADKPGATLVSSANKSNETLSKFQFNSLSNQSTSTFSFGSTPTPNNGFVFGSKPSVEPSTFTFGQTVLTQSDQAVGFKPTLQATNVPALFGGKTQNPVMTEKTSIPIPPVTATPTYVFGSAANFSFSSFSSPKKSDSESVEFRFGSPQKYEFNFSGVRPHSPTKTPKSPRSPETPDVEDDDEVVSSDADNIYFTPVIPLPPKVDVKTGEEGETMLFCKRAKLYRFSDGEWKERGLGDIKILFDETGKRARLLMRREQVLKVCLNHYLTKDVHFEWRGEKSLTWAATDFSESEACPELFAIRFKNGELAQEFKEAIDNAVNLVEGQKSVITSTDTLKNFSFKLDSPPKIESNFTSGALSSRFSNSQQEKIGFENISEKNKLQNSAFTVSFKDKPTPSFFGQPMFESNDSKPVFGKDGPKFGSGFQANENDDDIEIVYEALPSPDKIAAAETLKLPKSFYLFESKDPCPGCIGCTDTIPPYKANVPECEEKKVESTVMPSDNSSDDKLLFCQSSAGTFSFTDLAVKSSTPTFSKTTDGKHAFAGAGTPLFANLNTSGEAGNDDTVPENPDIHFEPVIPLPDLVEVKTGEEDEKPLFVHRAKLFRFDGPTKQWKERGIGDIKILSHKERTRFRIILRRDQVHNIACNHCITSNMSLAPLSTSENALCWNALDYSDGQAEASKFAVRFKGKETLEQFRNVFNECLEIIKKTPQVDPENVLNNSPTNACSMTTKTETEDSQPKIETLTLSTVIQKTPDQSAGNVNSEEQNSDDISDEDDDDILFEKRVSFEIFDDETKQFKNAGIGSLQVIYDDTVYGYRVTMLSDQNETICDHVIAVQNCLRLDEKKAIWSAIDISLQPHKRRQFRATFSSLEAAKEFQKIFEEGKESAVQSGIVEL